MCNLSRWNQREREMAREKVERGLSALAQGLRYADAAREAGYADPFQFSRACHSLYGARPRAVIEQNQAA